MVKKSDKLLSLVLLSYYSNSRIPAVYAALAAILKREGIPFEFIVMDDGSEDNSYEIARQMADKHENVSAYRLSRNFGSPSSCFAGLSIARGACAMPIVDDEQQPYETIVAGYREWEKGAKIVIPNRSKRADRMLSSFFSNLFYTIMNVLSDVVYPSGGADLALMDREVLDILLTRVSHINTTLMPEVLRLGFSPVFIPYERPLGLNKGKSRWTLRKKVKLAVDIFFSASSFPIKFITVLGCLTSLCSIAGIIFYVYITLWGNPDFWGRAVRGWTSLLIAIMFFSGLVLFSLGIIAEYIFRIYEEVKKRPSWIVRNDR
jgi:glycosyltransferase involved in cell wall biosynthesis